VHKNNLQKAKQESTGQQKKQSGIVLRRDAPLYRMIFYQFKTICISAVERVRYNKQMAY